LVLNDLRLKEKKQRKGLRLTAAVLYCPHE
jgi:hypothetical protein